MARAVANVEECLTLLVRPFLLLAEPVGAAAVLEPPPRVYRDDGTGEAWLTDPRGTSADN